MASLLMVSGERVELEPGRSYTFGRAPDCRLAVRDPRASWHHARILVGAGGLSIEDLGSRNGTLVDDKPIRAATPLQENSRIKIGGTTFLVSFLDAGAKKLSYEMEDAPYEATMTMESRTTFRKPRVESGAASFAGQIGPFPLRQVLGFVAATGQSGTLHIAVEEGEGKVEVRGGEIRDAEFGEARGLDALRALAECATGLFWLVEHRLGCPRTIQTPIADVLASL